MDRRLIAVFCFGIASGYPWVMISSALSAWLKEEGLSRSAIGLFGVMFVAYSINFLWSPLLDRIRPPFLGQRRGWIVITQLAISLCCVLMSRLTASEQLFNVALFGLLIAIFSATQDIAIDAFRIDVIGDNEKHKLSLASALATAGWWTGYGGLGAIPFFLADMPGWQWNEVYLVLGGIMLLLSCTAFFIPEPQTHRLQAQQQATQSYQALLGNSASPTMWQAISCWLLVTLVEPFRDFFKRNNVKLALSVLLFIFLFKIGEAFLGRMSIVFYKEIGFSNSDIGTYSKLLNWWVTIVFALIGGMVNIRYGIYRGLMIAGIAMAASNLMFAWMAQVGPNKVLFAAAVIVDGFTAAWSSVALVAFISLLCNKAFSASQYALMASLSTAGRTFMASASGFIVDGMGGNWSLFFILTALMVIPSLLFLRTIKDDVIRLEKGLART
ncbi:AmpG family muropeptide MFS transporter [Aestuariibacter salexigens]|uniref:AmpG family muropeptide MFS transporter n=1 Tax=Aestuariibacter salexigens TaxID=226010 RepID=UPI000419E039|nr:MFS transporter [Aestuariibacter salexigens]